MRVLERQDLQCIFLAVTKETQTLLLSFSRGTNKTIVLTGGLINKFSINEN